MSESPEIEPSEIPGIGDNDVSDSLDGLADLFASFEEKKKEAKIRQTSDSEYRDVDLQATVWCWHATEFMVCRSDVSTLMIPPN